MEEKKVTTIKKLTGKKDLDTTAQCLKMNMQDLVRFAEAQDPPIDTYDKTRVQILTELGITKAKGGKVYVRAQPSPEKMRFLIERHYPIPMNTVFPTATFNDWMKIVAKEPWAFNGIDLTDMSAEVLHTLKTKVKCPCGATIKFPKDDTGHYLSIMVCRGVPKMIHRKGKPYEVQSCLSISRFRKWIRHDVPQD